MRYFTNYLIFKMRYFSNFWNFRCDILLFYLFWIEKMILSHLSINFFEVVFVRTDGAIVISFNKKLVSW